MLTPSRKSQYGVVYLDERVWSLVLSSSQVNFAKLLVLCLVPCWNRLNCLRTTLFLHPTFSQHPFNFCRTNVGQMLKTFKRAFRFTNVHVTLSKFLHVRRLFSVTGTEASLCEVQFGGFDMGERKLTACFPCISILHFLNSREIQFL